MRETAHSVPAVCHAQCSLGWPRIRPTRDARARHTRRPAASLPCGHCILQSRFSPAVITSVALHHSPHRRHRTTCPTSRSVIVRATQDAIYFNIVKKLTGSFHFVLTVLTNATMPASAELTFFARPDNEVEDIKLNPQKAGHSSPVAPSARPMRMRQGTLKHSPDHIVSALLPPTLPV